jgi:hypothetical protein
LTIAGALFQKISPDNLAAFSTLIIDSNTITYVIKRYNYSIILSVIGVARSKCSDTSTLSPDG